MLNTFFDCQFDGSTSTTPAGPIQSYIWTYFVGPRTQNEPSTSPLYKPTESSCNFFGGLQTVSAGGLQFVGMRVDLQVRDAAGNKRRDQQPEHPDLPGWSMRLRFLNLPEARPKSAGPKPPSAAHEPRPKEPCPACPEPGVKLPRCGRRGGAL